ncbi:MAG: hypothetical protein KF902_02750 [Phycisphaeraceae bacterium]|nr:hypothetical protein [Phycisphaeraceae bacterium]
MPAPIPSRAEVERLRSIRSFPQLIKYLRDDLDWPIETEDVEDITFEYSPEELGLDAKTAVKVKGIKQLRPLTSNQPWGIFFVNFEVGKLPVVVLRRVLRSLVLNKRGAAKKAGQAAWDRRDLLFISAYGESDDRALTFAHFADPPPGHETDLPTLKVLGWDDDDTTLHLDKVDRDLRQHLRWPADSAGVIEPTAWRNKWSRAFTLGHGEVVRTSKDLAVRLAALAGKIRKRARTVIAHESEKGELRTLHKAFREALIHDLTENDFADMYAQTIAYGLLTAAVSRHAPGEGQNPVTADSAVEMVPVTNPFLKEMLERFLKAGGRNGHAGGGAKSSHKGIDFDELGISEVVDLLRTANMEAVLRDFGNKNPLEDPVIHFYELFLKEYDPKKRMQRGVFYTPRPVVSFIVRSVHEILQKEFGLADGLADTATWGEMLNKHPGLKLPTRKEIKPGAKDPVEVPAVKPEDPFVAILDPATGTGTFLVEVIDTIHTTLVTRWRREGKNAVEIRTLWNQYVPAHLLPRLHGYELMPAPYAIAHMKIGLKLHETGYGFESDERVRVYLTNALEPAQDFSDRLEFDVPELAHEAQAVNAVKRSRRFNTIIGNPPYSNYGQLNRIPFIMGLLDTYKEGLNEKKLNLDDDFIKFLRFAQFLIESAGIGVLGFITNNTYFDGITHRQMRRAIRLSMSTVRVLDLHGSSLKKETGPDGSPDENVFDIQQGVGISFWSRCGKRDERAPVYHGELWGSRDAKAMVLLAERMETIQQASLDPHEPYQFFVPKDFALVDEYRAGISLTDVFRVDGNGVKTDRDDLFIDESRTALRDRIEEFFSAQGLKDPFRTQYRVEDSSSYPLLKRRRSESFRPSAIQSCLYRPFDQRWIYYSVGLTSRPAWDVMRHMLGKPSLGLLAMRQFEYDVPEYCYFLACRGLSECRVFISNRGIANCFPLYADSGEDDPGSLLSGGRRGPNLQDSFITGLAGALGVRRAGEFRLPEGVTAEHIFAYLYAVFHSPTYRTRYAPFLKIEFPRVHLPSHPRLFHTLSQLGQQLVDLHLMEVPDSKKASVSWVGSNRAAVDGVWHRDEAVWIDRARTNGFRGVPETVWNFHIGGYQVCEKWLKDRKGRTLSKEDIEHYQKIVVAISETIRIMGEIDKVIEEHGGWPGAFITDPAELEKLGIRPSNSGGSATSPRTAPSQAAEADEADSDKKDGPELPFA